MSVVNHKVKLVEAHLKKLEEGQFNDIRIICKDGVVEANKFMLSVQNDYFKAMFESPNFKEGTTGEVMIECSKTMMDAIVKYLYNGVFDFEAFRYLEILDLINLARMMLLEPLQEDAIKYFKDKIRHTSDALRAIEIADGYKEEDLVDFLFKFLEKKDYQLKDFSTTNSDEIKKLSAKNMKRLIFGFKQAPQINKFKAFGVWVDDKDNKEKICSEMKKEIMDSFDTSKFSTKEVLEDVRKSKLYSDDMVIDMIGNNYFKLEDKVKKLQKAKADVSELESIRGELGNVRLRLTQLDAAQSLLNCRRR